MRINAVRLKGQINENGKMLAYNNDLPELNHNEIVGWQNNPEIFKYLCVLWLEDDNDNNRTKIRKNITEKILNEINIPQYSIQIIGESFQERFLHMIHYGDWLSFWCAILHETDPSPVEKIVRLKIRAKESITAAIDKDFAHSYLYDNGAHFVSKVIVEPIVKRVVRDSDILNHKDDYKMFEAFIKSQAFEGNISKTANFIGMERSALHRKLKQLDINEDAD